MFTNHRIFLNVVATCWRGGVCLRAEGSAGGGNGIERDRMLKFAQGVWVD